MRCISPLMIRTNNRRDVVPCGQCNFCLQVKRADWSFRLQQEYKLANTALFLTLTYVDEQLPVNDSGKLEVRKVDLQLFTKRLRKANATRIDWPLRYYSVAEYGTRTFRPHYHSIMFNVHPSLHGDLKNIWSHGDVHAGDVSPASIHYVTKYVINRHGTDYTGREPP